MGNMKQGVYLLQAKGNSEKCGIRNENNVGSSIRSSNRSIVNQNNLTIYIKILGALLMK
jgi:hypothetical protein